MEGASVLLTGHLHGFQVELLDAEGVFVVVGLAVVDVVCVTLNILSKGNLKSIVNNIRKIYKE